VYDPRDLAAVAAGAKKQWQIQPKDEWADDALAQFHQGYSGDGNNFASVTFDPKTNRLYVLITGAWHDGVEDYPQMYVYQVGAPAKPRTP
jgi:hypothetical protein